jgi:DNA-directed RNA polymerase specialized sigma24 family protein
MEELEKYLRALVLLQLDAQRQEGEARNPMLLLSQAGFANPEIAELLDKNTGAVQKAVERARKSGSSKPAKKGSRSARKARTSR